MFRRYDVAVTAATRREPARCHRRASKEPHGRAQDPQLPLDPRRPQVRPSRRQVRHDHAPAPRQQAVRAGHQRADARPDQPVPLRGARHLPADPHAGGARQQQEGHDRGRAQRAAGVALPRRTGQRRAQRHRRGHPARGQVRRRRVRAAVPADRGDHHDAAAVARQRQGRQPDHRRGHAPAGGASQAQRSSWCPRTSTCGSRRARWASPPRTTSTTRCSRTPTCSTAACASCRPDFWDRHGKAMESWQQGGHTYYRIQGPLVPVAAGQRVPLPRASGPGAAARDGPRDRRPQRRDLDARRTTRTRRTTSGASSRATASRTSPSTC